jgi:hypothetical protein
MMMRNIAIGLTALVIAAAGSSLSASAKPPGGEGGHGGGGGIHVGGGGGGPPGRGGGPMGQMGGKHGPIDFKGPVSGTGKHWPSRPQVTVIEKKYWRSPGGYYGGSYGGGSCWRSVRTPGGWERRWVCPSYGHREYRPSYGGYTTKKYIYSYPGQRHGPSTYPGHGTYPRPR